MAIFYHVSTELHHNGSFVPRIPQNNHVDEDLTIPRICVTPTIEGCFTALPGGGYSLDDLNKRVNGLYLIFRIDTEKLGIKESDVYTAEELYQRDLVRDADLSDEHWITCEFTVPEEERFMIQVSYWEMEEMDLIPASIYQIADEHYRGDYLEAYRKEYDVEYVPSSVIIKNMRYIKEQLI